jgi:nucleoside-diphosphate-sugar epimerase
MKVFLTGATGFLGSFVLRELSNRGAEVVALRRDAGRAPASANRVRWVRGDFGCIHSLRALRGEVEAADAVVHLGSSLSVAPLSVIRQDVCGTFELLRGWERGAWLYCSSTDVYGRLSSGWADEDEPLNPRTWYGLGKVWSESLCLRRETAERRVIVGRAPYIVGRHPRFKGSVIGRLMSRVREGQPVCLPERGMWKAGYGTSWVEARGLARWMVDGLEGGAHGIHNTVSGYITWLELLDSIFQVLGRSVRVEFSGTGDPSLGLLLEARNVVSRFAPGSVSPLTSLTETLREIAGA